MNNVCFCFPFFLFFPDTSSSVDRVCVAGSIVEDVPEPPPQTLVGGVLGCPKIFINDTLPLTGNLVLVADDGGNSGN